jgi:hypothetical protein
VTGEDALGRFAFGILQPSEQGRAHVELDRAVVLRLRLRGRYVDPPLVNIHVRPRQGERLAEPATRQEQEPNHWLDRLVALGGRTGALLKLVPRCLEARAVVTSGGGEQLANGRGRRYERRVTVTVSNRRSPMRRSSREIWISCAS